MSVTASPEVKEVELSTKAKEELISLGKGRVREHMRCVFMAYMESEDFGLDHGGQRSDDYLLHSSIESALDEIFDNHEKEKNAK